MKKLIFAVACLLSTVCAQAQSEWSITPEAGITAVQRINGDGWRPGAKVGAQVNYQFTPGWIGLRTGLFYTNRGYSMGPYPQLITEGDHKTFTTQIKGSITQHFLQLPIMADFSWKIGENARMHWAGGMYVAASLSNKWEWGSSYFLSNYHPGYGQGIHQAGYENGYDYNAPYEKEGTPFDNHSHFDWGVCSSIGVEVNHWVVNLGYELSLGDEGDAYKVDFYNGSISNDRSIGANFHTISLSVGYKFTL